MLWLLGMGRRGYVTYTTSCFPWAAVPSETTCCLKITAPPQTKTSHGTFLRSGWFPAACWNDLCSFSFHKKYKRGVVISFLKFVARVRVRPASQAMRPIWVQLVSGIILFWLCFSNFVKPRPSKSNSVLRGQKSFHNSRLVHPPVTPLFWSLMLTDVKSFSYG